MEICCTNRPSADFLQTDGPEQNMQEVFHGGGDQIGFHSEANVLSHHQIQKKFSTIKPHHEVPVVLSEHTKRSLRHKLSFSTEISKLYLC